MAGTASTQESPQEKSAQLHLKRKSQSQYFLAIMAGLSMILIAILFPFLGMQYGFSSPLGISYTALGLTIGALAVGVIYHSASRKTLSDRIDRLQRRMDLLLLDPNSPLMLKFDDSKQELIQLEQDLVSIEKKIGQSGKSLTSEISAKISQVKELLEL
jgi:hypothetical protein